MIDISVLREKRFAAIAILVACAAIAMWPNGARTQDFADEAASDQTVEGEPEVAALAGNWIGDIEDSVAGSGELDLTIRQRGKRLSGVWQTQYDDASFDLSGILTGHTTRIAFSSTTSPTVIVLLKPGEKHTCKFKALGGTDSATEISGTYTTIHCSDGDSGTFDLFKQ